MKVPRVPDKLTSPVNRLCNRLTPNNKPFYVPVRPEPNSQVDECFVNVDDKVKKDGGRVQYGLVIWYTPGVLMEAEFHAIWVSPHGEHVDVSRHVIDIDTILFLPDPTRTYTGRQVDNVRIPVSKDPRVKEFIHLHESLFKVKYKGDPAT